MQRKNDGIEIFHQREIAYFSVGSLGVDPPEHKLLAIPCPCPHTLGPWPLPCMFPCLKKTKGKGKGTGKGKGRGQGIAPHKLLLYLAGLGFFVVDDLDFGLFYIIGTFWGSFWARLFPGWARLRMSLGSPGGALSACSGMRHRFADVLHTAFQFFFCR